MDSLSSSEQTNPTLSTKLSPHCQAIFPQPTPSHPTSPQKQQQQQQQQHWRARRCPKQDFGECKKKNKTKQNTKNNQTYKYTNFNYVSGVYLVFSN